MAFRPEWNRPSDRYGVAGLLRNLHRHPNVPSCHLPKVGDASGRVAEGGGMWHTIRILAG